MPKVHVKVKLFSKIPRVKEVNNLLGEHSLEVSVGAAPKDGEANKELIALIADFYNLKKDDIKILSGHTSRNKIVFIPKVVSE